MSARWIVAATLLALSVAPKAYAEGGEVSASGSLNELRVGALFGLFSRGDRHRVYQGMGVGALLGGDVIGPLGEGDTYPIFLLSTDILVLGSGTNGVFGRTGGDLGVGYRVDGSAGNGGHIVFGYHGVFDSLGINPDNAELGNYEHGLLVRGRVELEGMGIEAGVAGLLGTGWIFQGGIRWRFGDWSIGSHAELHTLPRETDDMGQGEWGRDVLTVSTFVAIHP